MGATLGLVWIPCISGPFGAIVGTALKQHSHILVSLIFSAYAFGILTPLLMVSVGLKRILLKNKAIWLSISKFATPIIGIITTFLGILFLFKWEKVIETWIINLVT